MANLLRVVILLLVGCGLFVHIWLIPNVWQNVFVATREWLVLAAAAILPCYGAMVMAWMIAGSIAKENEFSHKNAALFKWIALLAVADSGIFLAASAVLFVLERALIWNLLASVPLAAAGICIAICAAVLSRLVDKAADLRDEADLTI